MATENRKEWITSQIQTMTCAGHSRQEIADALGMTKDAVRYHIRNYMVSEIDVGLIKGMSISPHHRVSAMREILLAGVSLSTLADALGVSSETLKKIVEPRSCKKSVIRERRIRPMTAAVRQAVEAVEAKRMSVKEAASKFGVSQQAIYIARKRIATPQDAKGQQ